MGKFKFQNLIKSHNIICALIINLSIGSATAETYVLGTLSKEVPPEYVLKSGIKDGERIQVSDSEILNSDLSLNNNDKVKFPGPFVATHVGTDNAKRSAIIGIDAEQRIWMGDGNQWTYTEPGVVSKQNDYNDALSIFPMKNGEWVGAVYTNFNPFNKGVMLVYGQAGKPARNAWAINSNDRNYGLNPTVHWMNGIVLVEGSLEGLKVKGGWEKAENTKFAISIPEQDVRSMVFQVPPHAKHFQDEENLSFMIGGSLARLGWYAESSNALSKVNYEIANTLFKGINIEGRYGSRNLAVSYIQNQVEDIANQSGGTIAKEASSRFFGYFDFESKVGSEDSLRMTIERAVLRGVATYVDQNKLSQQTEFNNEYSAVALLNIEKKGDYFKFEYSQSKLPVVVGFRPIHAEKATVSIFEPEAQFQELRLGFGHDEMAYAHRNEVNYTNWYSNGEFMIGLGTMRVSDATVQSLKAAGDYEYNSILSFGFHVGGEAGYMVQQRSSTLRGFGHSFATGIQIKAHYVSQLATDSNKSYTEFNRTDILYGPFVRYNLIF